MHPALHAGFQYYLREMNKIWLDHYHVNNPVTTIIFSEPFVTNFHLTSTCSGSEI